MHAGMRQYWRDMDSLLKWTRSDPHGVWWKNFLRDSGGTGFWHETYLMKGSMEAIYDDVAQPIGFMRFAPVQTARGAMFGAAQHMEHSTDGGVSEATPAENAHGGEPVVSERELCGIEGAAVGCDEPHKRIGRFSPTGFEGLTHSFGYVK